MKTKSVVSLVVLAIVALAVATPAVAQACSAAGTSHDIQGIG